MDLTSSQVASIDTGERVLLPGIATKLDDTWVDLVVDDRVRVCINGGESIGGRPLVPVVWDTFLELVVLEFAWGSSNAEE